MILNLSSSDLRFVVNPVLRYIDSTNIIWIPMNPHATKGTQLLDLRHNQRITIRKQCEFPSGLSVQIALFADGCSVIFTDVNWRIHPVAQFADSPHGNLLKTNGTLLFAKNYALVSQKDDRIMDNLGECVISGQYVHLSTNHCSYLHQMKIIQ